MMNLKTFVKVGSISNLSDARYCAGYGVNMLGFNLDPAQTDAISAETAGEIMGWVAVDHFVLECGNLDSTLIGKLIGNFEGAVVQVDQLSVAKDLLQKGYPVIYRMVIKDQADFYLLQKIVSSLPKELKYLLVETEIPSFFDELQNLFEGHICPVPVLKGFGNHTESIAQMIDEGIFFGIALKGSAEEKPGFKDYDELADILEVLEI